MISPPRFLRRSLAIVVALAMIPALSGCFANPIEGLVEQATGGQIDLGGTEIPEDFPTEVPLVSGDVQFAIAVGDTQNRGYNVTILAGAESPLEGIETELAEAGFDIQLQGSGAGGEGTVIFTSAEWAGGVIVANTADGYTANYTVAPAAN
ncbi:hypothetical protein FB472_0757 [Rhodoglobus vestalii]|uniref:Uncharacterized protein n=1 Tax=Rhodoglobus vestalii TaxID=193384 RepID=A0A8H2K732_9MICO|nr:hypothetical protein [Rhodoglobus vestalii]TQO19217.1 hypothetical protein FB472_0757 [Rhodoglobus vestalii]